MSFKVKMLEIDELQLAHSTNQALVFNPHEVEIFHLACRKKYIYNS
jgi:hypothetical protein